MTPKWTEDQVASANAYQRCGVWHPFTSAAGKDLIATADGWVEVEGGPVVQEWAHAFMLDWSWREDLSEFQRAIFEIQEGRRRGD